MIKINRDNAILQKGKTNNFKICAEKLNEKLKTLEAHIFILL